MRELDQLAKQFSRESVSLHRKDVSLYGRNLQLELSGFIKDIEGAAKRGKTGKVILVAILHD